jgi:thiol:disulfide interchange protein DsbA
MNRRIAIASALVAAALGGPLAQAAEPAAAPAAAGSWRAGTNYLLVPAPKRPQVSRDKVQVNEVFWYGCSHCYALEPALAEWKSKKPAFIDFVRTPVMWGPMHRQHAKLFYTIEALNRGDLHAKVFDSIHNRGNILAAQAPDQGRALHLAFLKENGVTEKAFAAAYDSAAVSAGLSYAEQVTLDFSVGGVPLMIVQGKYTTNVSMAGGEQQLLSVITDLAASEKRR